MLSPVEEIKSRLDIVELIQSYVKLQKAGINYKAVCPFHSEKTPSFFISPTRQIWHCFGGCGKGGDIFTFVMEIEGLDFPEALKLLAARAGVVLRREDPAIRSERNRLYDICEAAAHVFERNLTLTPVVKSYLQKRGVREETMKEFRIGFAPQSWDFLLKALSAKGFRREDVQKAGLAIQSEDNSSFYDRFRSRIMFPITDANGRVIGFGGRIFALPAEAPAGAGASSVSTKATDDVAKYINTPNTPIYDKSSVLYGFDKARQEIRIKNQAVLVEGYMDCVMSHQAGVKNAIAVSGTALTPHHLKTIRRLADTIACSFDTDVAGDSATKRSLGLASEFEFERKVVAIPSGKDPADTILENPSLWTAAVENAESVVRFYFTKALRTHNAATVDGKKAIAALLLPYIRELTNEIEKAHWVGELSKRLGIDEQSIRKELGRTRDNGGMPHRTDSDVPVGKTVTRRDLLEERLLSVLSMIKEDERPALFSGIQPVFRSAFNGDFFALLTGQKDQKEITAEEAKNHELIRFKGEVLAEMTENVKDEVIVLVRELEKERVHEELAGVTNEIEAEERKGNREEVSRLLESFRELSHMLKKLT